MRAGGAVGEKKRKEKYRAEIESAICNFASDDEPLFSPGEHRPLTTPNDVAQLANLI